ncbi:MAG: sigma-70 family RNA polymerase sigma factor [bacterium]
MTDQELIAAARDGDDGAFKELVVRYEPVVAATVIGMLGNSPEAEDVGQETFIRFYRALGSFRGDSSVKTYITRIAMNQAINEIRKRQRSRRVFSSTPAGELPDIPDDRPAHDAGPDRELIEQAMRKLDDDFRAVVVLRLIDGYSTAETAEILDIPVGTVLSRLSRAQKKLKSLLRPVAGEL